MRTCDSKSSITIFFFFFFLIDYYSLWYAFSHTKKCAHVQLLFDHSVDMDIMSKSFQHFSIDSLW